MTLPTATIPIGAAIARRFEGCRLAPYRDVRGLPTIGWGNRCLLSGEPVTMATHPLTQAGADALFAHTLDLILPKLAAMLRVPVTACQAGALLSLGYNTGMSALAGSNIIRHLNAGLPLAAADDMLEWDHSGGTVLAGLLARRQYERRVFLGLENPLGPAPAVVPHPSAPTPALHAATAPLRKPVPMASGAQTTADALMDAYNPRGT